MFRGQDVEVDEDRKIIYAVDAIPMDHEGYIILIKSTKEYFEGKWLLVGGKRREGEPIREAVLRELKEELGIDGLIKNYIGQTNKKGRDRRFHPYDVVSDFFLVELLKGEIKTDDREIAEWRRFTPRQIMGMGDQIGLDHYEMMERAGVFYGLE